MMFLVSLDRLWNNDSCMYFPITNFFNYNFAIQTILFYFAYEFRDKLVEYPVSTMYLLFMFNL